ncbi:putative receptor protein kinase ZmPK1 [Tanacetum coccineum]
MEAKMVSNIKVRDVDEPLEIRVEEIRRGGACVVYNGRLSNNRITAIKRLNNTNNQGEAEFHAEVSIEGEPYEPNRDVGLLCRRLQQHQIYNKIEMKSAISSTLTEEGVV